MITTDITLEEFASIDSVCFPADRISDREFLHIDQSQMGVFRQDHRAAGFVYYKTHGDHAHLHRIAVLPQFRNRGIGHYLLQYFIECTTKRGASRYDLWVQTDNDLAKKLYAKEGFSEKEMQAQIEIRVDKAQIMGAVSAKWAINSEPPPLRYHIEFSDKANQQIGHCTLDPEFPGCSTFMLSDPQIHFWPAIASFSELLTKKYLKLLVADPKIVDVACTSGGKLNYQIVRMERHKPC